MKKWQADLTTMQKGNEDFRPIPKDLIRLATEFMHLAQRRGVADHFQIQWEENGVDIVIDGFKNHASILVVYEGEWLEGSNRDTKPVFVPWQFKIKNDKTSFESPEDALDWATAHFYKK